MDRSYFENLSDNGLKVDSSTREAKYDATVTGQFVIQHNRSLFARVHVYFSLVICIHVYLCNKEYISKQVKKILVTMHANHSIH